MINRWFNIYRWLLVELMQHRMSKQMFNTSKDRVLWNPYDRCSFCRSFHSGYVIVQVRLLFLGENIYASQFLT